MATVTIATKLWDMNAKEWHKVHTVTCTMTEDNAKVVRDIFMVGSTIRSGAPKEYKKFTTEMSIEDDNGNVIGGFVTINKL